MIAPIRGRSRRSDQRGPLPSPPSVSGEGVEQVLGLRAGLAVFERRRDDVVAVAFAREVRGEAAGLLRWAAARRVPCDEMTGPQLDRVAGDSHHEGLCVETRPRAWASAREVADALVRSRGAGIALDRVRNPYNVGAILRTAAFFGLEAVVLGAIAPRPALAPLAVRVAEGGAERVRLARTTDLAETLARLRDRGVRVVGADTRSRESAFGFAFAGPVVVVVGNEREGLGDRVRAQCDALAAIPGAGGIESLNVAVAAGILVAEACRGRRPP